MNRKLIVLLVALLAVGVGLVLALTLGSHEHAPGAAAHSDSGGGAVAALVASSAAVIAASAARRKKKRDE